MKDKKKRKELRTPAAIEAAKNVAIAAKNEVTNNTLKTPGSPTKKQKRNNNTTTAFTLPKENEGVDVFMIRSTEVDKDSSERDDVVKSNVLLSVISRKLMSNFNMRFIGFVNVISSSSSLSSSSSIEELETSHSSQQITSEGIDQGYDDYFSFYFGNKNRCYLEDFMTLKKDESLNLATILIPYKLLTQSSKYSYINKHFLHKVAVVFTVPSRTTKKDYFYAFKASIKSSPSNEKLECSPMLRSELQDGLGVQNYGVIFTVHDYDPYFRSKSLIECDILITWKEVLDGRTDGIQVWKNMKVYRNLSNTFSKITNESKLLHLLNQLYQEVFGDVLQVSFLLNAYYAALNRLKSKSINSLQIAANDALKRKLDITIYSSTTLTIDNTFKVALEGCYTSFSSVTQPIISDTTLLELIAIYKNNLPQHFNMMREILGFDLKSGQMKLAYLSQSHYYDKILFFQFLIQSRLRCNKNFIYWAMINAAAHYAKGRSRRSTSSNSFFGTSAAITTFLQNTESLRSNMKSKLHLLLREQSLFVASLDNNQKGYNVCFQRDGKSYKYVKVTTTALKDVIYHNVPTPFEFDTEYIELDTTYVNQAIPSPHVFPKYEILLNERGALPIDKMIECIVDVIADKEFTCNLDKPELYPPSTCASKADVSGKRVSAYVQILNMIEDLDMIRKVGSGIYSKKEDSFKFVENMLPEWKENTVIKAVVGHLHNSKESFLNKRLQLFQSRIVEYWNPSLKDVSKFVIPPVSLHDEIKTDGYGMCVIELLNLVGILVKKSSDVDCYNWDLAHDYKNKTVILCLDGLSLDRHKSFSKKLVNLPISFQSSYKQSIIFRKALERVVEVSGPLHMAFHMLQSIYNIYRQLLKCAQNIVQWKKLKMSKVSECFRLAESLCYLLYDELYRYFFFTFLHEESSKDAHHASFISIDRHKDCCTLAIELREWISRKAETTTDNCWKYCLYFIKLVALYRKYRAAMESGDAIAMEFIERDFCGVFYLLKKHKYVDIILSQMEKKYQDSTYTLLETIRLNSSCRYLQGSGPKKVHVLDEMVENVNNWIKMLPISGTQDSWVYHSPNVIAARRSLIFERNIYRKGPLNVEKAINEGVYVYSEKNETHQVTPSQKVEKKRIFEFIVKLLKTCRPSRFFVMKEADKLISELQTKFQKTNDTESKDVNVDLIATMQSINNLRYDKNDNINNDDDNIDDEFEIEVQLQIDEDNDDTNELLDNNNIDNESNTNIEGSDSHVLSIIDVVAHGKRIMLESSQFDLRNKKENRSKRQDSFITDLFLNVSASNNTTTNEITSIQQHDEPNEMEMPSFVRLFRQIKMRE